MIKKRIATLCAVAAFFLVPYTAFAQTASEKLQEAVTEFKTRVEARITELEALQNSGASNVEIRLATSIDVLEQADTDLQQLQEDVVYVLFLNGQEKRVLRTLFHAIDGQVRVYLEGVEAIDADLQAGTITEDEAATQLNAQLEDATDFLSEHSDDFREQVHATLKLKVQAAVTYMGFGFDYSNIAEAAYEEMGYNTNRVEELLSKGEELYDAGVALYNEAKDNEDADDIESLRESARKLILARRQLTKAQSQLKVFEQEWEDARSTDGTEE